MSEERVGHWVKQPKPRPRGQGLEMITRMQKRKNFTNQCFDYEPVSQHFFVDGTEVDEPTYREEAAKREIPVADRRRK